MKTGVLWQFPGEYGYNLYNITYFRYEMHNNKNPDDLPRHQQDGHEVQLLHKLWLHASKLFYQWRLRQDYKMKVPLNR